MTWNVPSRLKTAYSFPFTLATIPAPGATSAVPATRTKLDMALYLLLALFFFAAVAGFFAFPLAVRFFFAALFFTARGFAFLDFFTGARDDVFGFGWASTIVSSARQTSRTCLRCSISMRGISWAAASWGVWGMISMFSPSATTVMPAA